MREKVKAKAPEVVVEPVVEPVFERVEPPKKEVPKEKPKAVHKEEARFTIVDLENGKLVEELNEAIKVAALDVKMRPTIRKPRKIVWELAIAPTDGGFVGVQAEIPKVSLPRDKAIATICGMPDDEGNLRNLQNQTTAQYQLPINFYDEN
jgi:hypothetical protein